MSEMERSGWGTQKEALQAVAHGENESQASCLHCVVWLLFVNVRLRLSNSQHAGGVQQLNTATETLVHTAVDAHT